LSKGFAADHILVNAVLIGIVKSNQWERAAQARNKALEETYEELGRLVPLGRVGDATEFGDLVAFLASDRASFISGAAINFDGGAATVP
jgi:NAD(P)-dependent dehydrogenase (short-subunit alcohol dehydrogenase family)